MNPRNPNNRIILASSSRGIFPNGVTTGRRKGRGRGRQTSQLDPRAMAAQRLVAEFDPPPVNLAIKHIHKLQFVLTPASGVFSVTNGTFSSYIPGGTAAFISFRVMKISVWGLANSDGTIRVTTQWGTFTDEQSDVMTFQDSGTMGQSRPQLHIIPSFAQRNHWVPANSTGTEAIFSGLSNSSTVTIQLTLELQTVASTAPLG